MFNLNFQINKSHFNNIVTFAEKHSLMILSYLLSLIAISGYVYFYNNHLGLAYNDARSHLDIGRRVVEGLKPGLAQLGSVWLPLPHVLIALTVWNDFMWHSGLSGALVSMISFVATGAIIYKFMVRLGADLFSRLFAVFIFVANINVLYLQSTAMTELLLLATMTVASYELLCWYLDEKLFSLIKTAFWVMLSTLVRYDGWFLFFMAALLVLIKGAQLDSLKENIISRKFFATIPNRYKRAEGISILFFTLGMLGILLWFLWNLLIFKDPLYFAFGEYSARAQQQQLELAGNLATKGNFWFSMKIYLYALAYNTGVFSAILGLIGAVILWLDKKLSKEAKIATMLLITPLIFNIVALYLGHSVLFIQGLSGNTWFNVRYGIAMIPSIAIFIGYLLYRLKNIRVAIVGLVLFVTFFQFTSNDAVTIDDARVGSSQKNVTEVSGWLAQNAKNKDGFILISAASHDAIIFSSELQMSRFIHEGTGRYWEEATTNPQHWARWIIMRTYDESDQTYKLVSKTPDLAHYDLVGKYPFADIYQLKEEFVPQLETKAIFNNQK